MTELLNKFIVEDPESENEESKSFAELITQMEIIVFDDTF